MYKKGQILKQARTKGNPNPGKTRYIFDHYTKSGKIAVLNASSPNRIQTFPKEFLISESGKD